MATTPIISASQEIDDNIRTTMRVLKAKLAASGVSRDVDDADIQDQQIARAREILFLGLPGAITSDVVDAGWVVRFNEAIADGNQEKAMRILVDKESYIYVEWWKKKDVLTLSWYPPENTGNVNYYRIWYKTSVDSSVYDGSGLTLKEGTDESYSYVVVGLEDVVNNSGVYSVRLYGDMSSKKFYFKIDSIDFSGNVIVSTKTYDARQVIRDVKYYRLHYRTSIDSGQYNGSGLSLTAGGIGQDSPINIASGSVTADINSMALKLYSNFTNSVYQMAIETVYADGSTSGIIPIKGKLNLKWVRPNIRVINEYHIYYGVVGLNAAKLLNRNGVAVASPLVVSSSSIVNTNAPGFLVYSDLKNVVHKFEIYAVSTDGVEQYVTTISMSGDAAPEKRNEYCELMKSADDEFGDADRVRALLWYINYIFFLENKNMWHAFRMIEERKSKFTKFPTTSPWYFEPKLKGAWERQEPDDQYVNYYEQEVKIPIIGVLGSVKKIVGYVRINQNLIDKYIAMDITGESGARNMMLSVEAVTEEYRDINTIVDLKQKMEVSGIGSVDVIEGYKAYPVANLPFKTYTRRELKITRLQEQIFILAYYGNKDDIQDLDSILMDFGSERRIRLEKWEDSYNTWLSQICDTIMNSWLRILELHPIGSIVDISALLKAKLSPGLLEIAPIVRDGEISEDSMQRLADIIKEDDAITPAFEEYMAAIYNYLVALPSQVKNERSDDTPMNEVLDRKGKTLLGQKESVQIDLFTLPKFWDLQKVSLLKFDTADFWKDLADFNDIGNPMSEIEMFEGRKIALPRMAEDRLSPVGK